MELPKWPPALVELTSFNVLYKGIGLLLVGILGLGLAVLFRARNGRQEVGWYIFVAISCVLVAAGIGILIFQPPWWPRPTHLR